VRTATVETGTESGRVVAATVTARQRATLAARMSAAVVRLPFREGETVRSGQVVAQLADEAPRSALAAAEAALAAAGADRERMERLLERGAATAQETESARARAAAAAAEVGAARDALRYTALRAPFSGRLARRLVREGDVVSPGQPLVEIEGSEGFELRASVDAAAAAVIAPGMALPVEVDGLAGALTATVRALTPAADPGTHRFEVVADLPGVEGLRSGLYGRLQLPAPAGAAEGGHQLTIPAAAAFARGGLTGVFVVEEGVARLRWIAAGKSGGERLAVRAGLEPGERVVLDPAGLADGDPVVEER
jgi:RND family efflux transporter MFP subunit